MNLKWLTFILIVRISMGSRKLMWHTIIGLFIVPIHEKFVFMPYTMSTLRPMICAHQWESLNLDKSLLSCMHL